MDITATQFRVLCSIRCEVCITPVELKTVLSVDPGAMTRMLDRLACKGWIERLPNPADKRGVLVQLTPDGAALCEQCHQVVGQKFGVNEKSVGGRSRHACNCSEGPAVKIRRGKMMSRRNNDAITIHSILSWIEDNLESPLSLEKVSERSGYSKWHLQRMFKKETGHSLGQYIRSRKLTEIAQKLKQSNEPILYLAERYGFESQQTLTRTFKNYFDVPPHKYRITNVPGESRYLHPLNN